MKKRILAMFLSIVMVFSLLPVQVLAADESGDGDAAGVARMEPWQRCALSCGYGQYEILRRFLEDLGARVEETSFGADVELIYSVAQGLSEGLGRSIYDKTSGTVEVIPGETVFRPVLVER